MQLLTHSAHQGTRAEGPRDAVLSTGSAADQARSAGYDGNGLRGRPVYHCKRGASEADQTIVFAALAASRRIEDQPAGQSGNRRYRTMPSWGPRHTGRPPVNESAAANPLTLISGEPSSADMEPHGACNNVRFDLCASGCGHGMLDLC